MFIDGKNLIMWLKSMYRGQPLPLDASEVHDSVDIASAYTSSPTAYAGQTIKVKMDDGKYHSFVLQESENGLVMEELISAPPVIQSVSIEIFTWEDDD